MRAALAVIALCAACGADAPDPGGAACRRAHDAYRAAFATAMGDRMAQVGSWAEKPDMKADLATGQEMADAMTARTMTRAELASMRAIEAKQGAIAPAWERAFTAAAAAIDACGEGVSPPPR